MKKILIAAVAAIVLASCGTTGPAAKAPTKKTFEIIEHKGSLIGKDTPNWVGLEQNEIQALPEYKDVYVFLFEERGASLDGVKIWANKFSARSELAGIIKTRVQDKFAGAAAGDKDKLETYFENISKSVADGDYSGAKKEADWWVKAQYYDLKTNQLKDEEVYTYFLLYTIDKKILDKQIAKAIDGAEANKPKTEEEKTARSRVREALAEGF